MGELGAWVAGAAVGLASCAQGLTGFGFSVVAVPLLLLALPAPTVSGLALLPSPALTSSLRPNAACSLLLAARLVPARHVGRSVGQKGSRALPARAIRRVTLGLVVGCGLVSAAPALAALHL